MDAYVESGKVQQFPISDRRLDVLPLVYPVPRGDISDVGTLRATIVKSSSAVGRSSDAKGGGNSCKVLRLMVKGLDADWSNAKLADALAGFGMIAVSEQEQG